MDEWTFGPVYPEVYATISPKVIVVGAEPNEQANRFPGRDMGQLLRLAPSNNYWGYEFYYRATLQQVRAVLTNIADQSDEGILRHVRYVDLKATGGGGSSRTAAVRNWVRDHLERIANYWLTDRPDTQCSKAITPK